MADKRYRNFSLMTYVKPTDLESVMKRHEKQIRAYAYITHEKDVNEFDQPKEKHIHLLLCLINNTTVEATRNWFNSFEDEKGQRINTLSQPMHDISASYDYLTHDTEQAKSENKYQYDKADIKGYNLDFFTDTAKQDIDNMSLALLEMCSGVPLKDIAKKYGRDFIIHYHSVKLLFNDIMEQNGGVVDDDS